MVRVSGAGCATVRGPTVRTRGLGITWLVPGSGVELERSGERFETRSRLVAHTADRGSTCLYCSKTFEVEPRRGQQLSACADRDRHLITEMCLPGIVSGEPDRPSWERFY